MGITYTAAHAAACAAYLPLGSAVAARINPEYSVTLRDLPIKVISDALKKDDGGETFIDKDELLAMPLDDFKAALDRPWKDS